MMKWLAANVYLASWLSVLIALVAMLVQSRRSGQPIRWTMATLRVGFLICLSAVLTPGLDQETRHVMEAMAASLIGVLVVRSGQE